ncbi:uncharacterized protein K441DRAFT_24514 [Cenococcum geophilum 1.58]|uniref:uncharacterized protein n=1 Tax=Cenococcum geophilum 1.58 TaxID=794803 RepID=UPI00358F8EFF|nr:hypothetical protein K441DRAFT_24514 [Cenococcum geophilum 1.58]
MSNQGYYQNPQPPQQAYGQPQGQYGPPQGQYGGYPPQGQMQYQQGPPQQVVVQKKNRGCLTACHPLLLLCVRRRMRMLCRLLRVRRRLLLNISYASQHLPPFLSNQSS